MLMSCLDIKLSPGIDVLARNATCVIVIESKEVFAIHFNSVMCDVFQTALSNGL